MTLATIPEALKDIREGKFIIIVDNEDGIWRHKENSFLNLKSVKMFFQCIIYKLH